MGGLSRHRRILLTPLRSSTQTYKILRRLPLGLSINTESARNFADSVF